MCWRRRPYWPHGVAQSVQQRCGLFFATSSPAGLHARSLYTGTTKSVHGKHFHSSIRLLVGVAVPKGCRATATASSVLASRTEPNASRGLFRKDIHVEGQEATLDCGMSSTLDLFAQSRITNYVKRIHSSSMEKTTSTLSLSKKVKNTERLTKVDIKIPVDSLFKGVLERSHVTASGLAVTPRDALIAACMHAERCLDALGIPLFSAEGRQRKRVEELRAEGRWAPQPHDAPSEFAEVTLPPPVCYCPCLLDEKTDAVPALPTPHSEKRNTRMAGEQPFQPASHSPQSSGVAGRRRRQRSKDFSRRFGSDPFLQVRSTFNEMHSLYQTILQHQSAVTEGEADEDDEDVPIAIEAHEVEILQPSVGSSTGSGGTFGGSSVPNGMRTDKGTASMNRPSPGSMGFIGIASQHESMGRSYYIPSHFQCVDETEGGTFKLVDVSVDKWLPEGKNPIAVCIRDSTVHERLREYWEIQRHRLRLGGEADSLSFQSCVTVHTAELETNVQMNHRWKRVLMKWFTASLKVPGLGDAEGQSVTAIGKATTLEAAQDLCAMHMEELLNFFGIPLSNNPETQMTHFDGCLRWGRCAAPEPIPLTKGLSDPNLPKPNKEWFVPRKVRLRVSPMTVTEKLQALNRRVVSQYRQHHVEVDLMHLHQYDEVMAMSPECLRDFMRAQHHPFECAILNFHLAPNEYRASVYLPLPAEYGVRGGCAVGRTQEVAYHLCALNAMDVLFALDCVPHDLLQRPRFQSYLQAREALQMLLPRSYGTGGAATAPSSTRPSPSLRSPPGIRDSPNTWCSRLPPAEDIWQVLMTNAEDFDVAPNPTHVPELQGYEVVNLLRRLFSRYVFSVTVRRTGGASSEPAGVTLSEPGKRKKATLVSPPAAPLKCLSHYCGYQHQNGLRRVRANNCWMELPLETSLYGRRIAYGRCLTRNGAERSFFIHSFRILRALRLAPWEELKEDTLRELLYYGDDTVMKKELDFWRLLVRYVLDPEGDTPPNEVNGRRHQKQPHVPAAELVGDSTSETTASVSSIDVHTPSPNPVMTPQLAALTLL